MSIFGHSGNGGEKWVGFGADQVILVRDDSARKEIASYIGHQALILTIVECKGLEFQDVLLYNFFGSSPLSNHWRVVYEFLNEKDLLDGDSAKSFPSFNQSKHNILCSELKQLYVAITRTKQRLWICENNVEVSKPMLDYWRRLSLVQMRKIDDSLAEAMQRASTPEEWKSQGMKLFWEKNYEMATMCFEKAGDEMWEKMAKASGLRSAANSLHGSNSDEATILLKEAAEIFDSIDRAESAAECFYDLGDYERSGRIYRDKCGKSELGKAGECFLLAGKHELAAEVYASGKFFRECLSACSKGNHFDLGLQYVETWKQQALSDSVVKSRFEEIDKIVQEFLENCARECFNAKDNASMMKFVRAFCSTESKRIFLKPLDCLKELLVLEEELGNFNEASEIAKSLGDTLVEIDLKEKAGEFTNACSLIHSYVISNALWGSGNLGWPLKSFPLKVELLNRSMSVAQKVSETFHASVCAQAKFLLYEKNNLSELMQFYDASKQHECPIGEVLTVRKLLDTHFEVNATKYEWDHDLHLDQMSFDQRIARNQVSVGGLVYLWNLWKEHSLKILDCLDSLGRTDSIELEGVVGFCFNYFGLRMPDDSSVTIHLLNPDAIWVKNVEGFIRRNRSVATLEARHFASAAGKFWLQEFICVGLRVLNALQQLHKSSMAKRLPVYCQCICLLHIFDIAKFLLGLKSTNMKYADSRKLQDCVQISTQYFEFVFPLDPRVSLSENMISLRETELSTNLLEESVFRNISGRRELSIGQIGMAVMTMLGTSKLKPGFYDKVSERLSNDSAWKPFIQNLKETVESDSAKASHTLMQESPLRCSTEALSQAFCRALKETYNIYWRAPDYISPHCFLYLVERLLILAPHPRGFFFTTKSSFLEYLICVPSDANPRTTLVKDKKPGSSRLVEFALHVVETCLFNRIETGEWIKKSGLNYSSYHRLFVLRLLMILCVLTISWDLDFDILNQKMARNEITSQLPKGFNEALRPRRRGYIQFVSAVSTAFKAINDPLVIVVSDGNNRNFPYPDALLLDLSSFSCQSDIMKTLFPRSTKASSDDQPATVERFVIKPSSTVMPPVVSIEGNNTTLQSLEIASKAASNSSAESGNGNLQINWDLIREISEAFESLRNRNDENLRSLLLRKKVEVEEHVNSITSAMTQITEQSSHSSEDKDSPDDASRLIEDLNTFLSLFCTSEYDSKAMTEIGKLLKSLEARRPQLDAVLLSPLVEHNDADAVVVPEENDYEKLSDNNVGDGDVKAEDCCLDDEGRETEDSASAATSNPSSMGGACSQGKGKSNKKKNKQKKKQRR